MSNYDITPNTGEGSATLIYPCASGIKWTTQTGGIMLSFPVVEGILLPLPCDAILLGKTLLEALHPNDHDGSADDCALYKSKELLGRLNKCFWGFGLPLLVIDHEDNQEAWIHVRIRDNEDPILRNFARQEAILTWENCD